MEMSKDYFIAIYTNKVKDYCDKEFFARINELKGDAHVSVVDNTIGKEYHKRLTKMGQNVRMISVPKEPERTQFLRNVEASVNDLRQEFLEGDWKYFLIIESDVIPPANLLERLDKSIEDIEGWQKRPEGPKPWGALGAIYYQGFHSFELDGKYAVDHVLSGCTVYKRELIARLPFRWSEQELGAFPDAYMSYDASNAGYSLWNDHDIKCEHLHAKNGTRQSIPL